MLYSDLALVLALYLAGPHCVPLLAATVCAAAGPLPAFHLLLMKTALAAAASLHIFLSGAAGRAVQAAQVLRRWIAACFRWKNLLAGAAGEPILAVLLVSLGFDFLLALFTGYSGRRQCHHGRLKMLDALGRSAPAALQALDGLAAGQTFLVVALLELGAGKASSILLILHMLHAILLASFSSLRVFGPVSPCLHCMHMAGLFARTCAHCSCS